MADNIHRNICVNWLDNFIKELLKMTIDMFNEKYAQEQKNKVSEKIGNLIELKKIIQSYE